MKVVGLIPGLTLIILMSFGQNHSCITQKEAEKILGRPAHLSVSNSENRNGIIKYRCTYTVNDDEIAGGKECNLFYLFEKYEKSIEAKKSFTSILLNNRSMSDLDRLSGLGMKQSFKRIQ